MPKQYCEMPTDRKIFKLIQESGLYTPGISYDEDAAEELEETILTHLRKSAFTLPEKTKVKGYDHDCNGYSCGGCEADGRNALLSEIEKLGGK